MHSSIKQVLLIAVVTVIAFPVYADFDEAMAAAAEAGRWVDTQGATFSNKLNNALWEKYGFSPMLVE